MARLLRFPAGRVPAHGAETPAGSRLQKRRPPVSRSPFQVAGNEIAAEFELPAALPFEKRAALRRRRRNPVAGEGQELHAVDPDQRQV